MHTPPLTQKELAIKIQLIGLDITPITLSRIEQNKRHVW